MSSDQPCVRPFDSLLRRLIAGVGLVALLCLSWPTWAGDVFRGQELYQTHCEACHGSKGVATVPGVPNFSRGEGLMQPDARVHAVIVSGKNACPGSGGFLRDVETLDVLSYLRTLH